MRRRFFAAVESMESRTALSGFAAPVVSTHASLGVADTNQAVVSSGILAIPKKISEPSPVFPSASQPAHIIAI